MVSLPLCPLSHPPPSHLPHTRPLRPRCPRCPRQCLCYRLHSNFFQSSAITHKKERGPWFSSLDEWRRTSSLLSSRALSTEPSHRPCRTRRQFTAPPPHRVITIKVVIARSFITRSLAIALTFLTTITILSLHILFLFPHLVIVIILARFKDNWKRRPHDT